MSIRDRLHDAQLLYANNCREGSLLSVLIAVAATSRRRYPRPFRDREAFTTFVAEEMPVITRGAVQNFNVRVPGTDKTKWPSEMMPLGECFYEFIRCSLAHEATLPANVEFFQSEPGTTVVDINDKRIRLSDSWIDGFGQAVKFAPENTDLFPELQEIPGEVISWMLFEKRRHNYDQYMHARSARMPK